MVLFRSCKKLHDHRHGACLNIAITEDREPGPDSGGS